MAHILVIGTATLDIINSVERYPQEDEEVRAHSQKRRRGGNAANTAVILAQLGHHCSWAGILSNDSHADFIRADLHRYMIDTSNSIRLSNGHTPTSYITHNLANGSRTIIHYRDLAEFCLDHFKLIDLSHYNWLHFEGRHCPETTQMVALAQQQRQAISIEIEKQRPGIETLFEFANLLLFSRAFAQQRGYQDGAEFLLAMRTLAPTADLVCAWGDKGAYSLDHYNQPSFSPAFPPPQLIDTLAAGDTFNAAIIDACSKGQSLAKALTAACQLAGRKCGVEGLSLLD